MNLLRCTLLFVTFQALWLLFVFQVNTSEWIAGAIGSVLAIIAVQKALHATSVPLRPRLSWFRNFWRVPGTIVRETFLLVQHLWMPAQSVFVQAQLRPPADPQQGPAQRSVALIAVSLTPNTVVLAISEQEQTMWIHMLQQQEIPQVLQDLQGA